MRIATLAVTAFLVWSCASGGRIPAVRSEYWKSEDYAAYRRYAWLPSDVHRRQATQAEDHRLHDLIREAIDEELAARGFEETGSGAADFLVTYHCKITEELRREVIEGAWYDGSEPYGSEVSEESVPRIELSTFPRGSIVIDFVKPESGRRVWRGLAQGRVSLDATRDEYKQIVDRSVRDILDEFPPGHGEPPR